jgi:hypothetical protein
LTFAVSARESPRLIPITIAIRIKKTAKKRMKIVLTMEKPDFIL